MRSGVSAVWLWGVVLTLAFACRSPVQAGPAQALDYVERVTHGADPKAPLPMLVALHGYGDTPENFLGLFEDLEPATRVIAVRAPDPVGPGSSWYPVDQAPQTKIPFILERSKRVVALIEKLLRERPTLGKPVVTGFSQGGALSLALAAYHSKHFRGAVPISGALPPGMPLPHAAASPFRVFAFHGEADRRIAYADAQTSVRALEAAGIEATLTGFPDVGHAIPEIMRAQIYAALRELLDGARSAARKKPLK